MKITHLNSRISFIKSHRLIAFKFLSQCLVLLLYGNQYRIIYVLYTEQRIYSRLAVPGVGKCLFLLARGWGIQKVCPGGWLQVELNHALMTGCGNIANTKQEGS